MKKLLLLLAAATLTLLQASASGKIYAIVMGATQDPDIGKSCDMDLDRFENELATLSSLLEMELVPTIRFDGNNCDRPHLEQGINQLKSCNREDIVFFYYSGHGMRAMNDKTKWPQLCMNYKDQRNWVPAHEVISKISVLPSHLKLILTDCCNAKATWVSAKSKIYARGASNVSEINYSNLEKLFIRQNGCLIATGCQVGESSLCNNIVGGFFTLSFWESIDAAATGEIKPTWDEVFKTTVALTRDKSRNQQTPLYEIPTDAPNPSPSPNATQTSQPVMVGNANVNQNMLGAISVLLNRNLSTGYRLKLIPEIINKYFLSSYSKVQTVGRDLQTIVDTEDVETFLRRITLDKKMRQINVITENKDDNGRCNYLKVHEVRNPLQQ